MRGMMQRAFARLFASLLLVTIVFSGAFFGLIAHVRAVAPPNIITYQGRLLNANGVPITDASASIIFRLYDASSGGSCVWSNSSATCASATARTVTLTDGLFSENLGDTAAATPYAAISDSTFGSNASIYLDVNVNGESLTPRKRLVAAPYAVNASTIDGFDSTQAGGTSAAALVLDSNGNLQLTGSPQGSGISQGSVYVNPAAGVVAANETLFAAAVGGSLRFVVDAEGDILTQGDLSVSGGDITSTAALAISSTSGDISFNANGAGLVYMAASDDFAVGASALAAPFSIDESANTLRLGDGVNDANTPTITMYASDGTDSGSITYDDDDRWSFAGGNLVFTTLGTLPTVADTDADDAMFTSTYTGTSGNSLNTLELNSLFANTAYSAIEGTSTDHYVASGRGVLAVSGATTTLTRGYGLLGALINTSTNASLVGAGGYLSGLEASVTQNAAGTTVADVYGAHGKVVSSAGTIAAATGVFGEVATGTGSVTTAYGGRFQATTTGTTRYGLYASASGGTTNYSGYFAFGALQVDDDATAAIPDAAKEAGDVYVLNELEVDGNAYFGDTSGTDLFTVTSAITGGTAASFAFDSLTAGTGIGVSRAAGGSDFDGTLFAVTQSNTSATSDADAVVVTNQGAGNSVGLYVTQNTLSAHVANSVGNNAFVIDVNEVSGSENVIIVRSDADGTPDTEFRVESDGDVFGDGAAYNAGADYAEFFRTSDMGLGDFHVVCQDPAVIDAVRRCTPSADAYVMGVVSTNAAFVGNNFRGASEDLSNDPNYEKIGMVGQIDTLVNADEGAIVIGDPITNSQLLVGYGAKASGPARIVGFALEPLSSGTGVIRVLVQPQWYGGDVLTSERGAIVAGANIVLAPMRTATASTSVDSADVIFRGSGWNGSSAVATAITLRNDIADGGSSSRLSVVNNAGAQVAYIGDSGDLAIAGRLYPSDRGTLQTSKYIYYDGSSGAGGDFMRTNASGWGSGSYDFAEMFPTQDQLAAGEVVVFADAKESVRRSTGTAYDDKIAGVVSTRPGFLAGDNKKGSVPIALVGRVPTYVSGENGAIAIGDPLTTSSKPGYAMKATEPGPIVGYAMEPFSGVTGVVVTFIRPSYFDGSAVEAPIAENIVSDLSSVAKLDVSGSMNMNGGSIISVASLAGIGNNWRLSENGDFVTRGSIVALVRSFAGEDIETFATMNREHMIELSGTSTLKQGSAKVTFEKIDPAFKNIIATTVPYRVIVTPAGTTGGVYVAERSLDGFTIRDMGNTSGVAVDWLVIAYHKDFAPEPVVEDVLADVEAVPIETTELPSTADAPIEVPVEVSADEPIDSGDMVDRDADAAPEAQVEVPTTEPVSDVGKEDPILTPTTDEPLAPAP